MFSVVVIVIQQLDSNEENCKSNSVLLFLEEWELYYISISI